MNIPDAIKSDIAKEFRRMVAANRELEDLIGSGLDLEDLTDNFAVGCDDPESIPEDSILKALTTVVEPA